MSGRRSSVSDYPEHLNPFHDGGNKLHFWGKIKRSGSLSNSLKDLRNTITLRSFRGHKKPKYERDSDVQLRNHTYNGYSTVSRQTLPVYQPSHIVTSTPLLPRSRFSERVRKSVDSSYDSSKNPFEDGEEDGDINEIKSEDYRKRVRRRKRRAPLPPGVKDSSWSLTSVETDISSYPHSEISDLDVSEIEKPMAEICEMLQSFTKEIEKMTDSFNGNDENNHKSEKPENAETHDGSIEDNENIACPKIVITSAECSPTKDDILMIESVSSNTQDADCGIEQKPPKEYSEGCENLQNVEESSHNNDNRVEEKIVNGIETGCDHDTIEEEPPPSSSDHEISSVSHHNQEIIEKQTSPTRNDHEVIIEKSPPSHHNPKIIEEKLVGKEAPPSCSDEEIAREELPSPERDHEIIEEKPSPLVCDLGKVEEKDDKVIHVEASSQAKEVEEMVHSNSEGLGVNHFSRYAHDMKYIDESYTIHDRVMDEDIRNDNSKKIDETNNNKEYIPNGSYKENKFPVEESDFANGNGTNINKNTIEEKEIHEQPPVPKVRKKKFTKSKLLGFFSGK